MTHDNESIHRIVVSRMVGDKVISERDKKAIRALQGLGKVMYLLEGLCLFGGLFYIYGNLGDWQYEDPTDRDTYCVFGEVVFAAIFVGMTNLFLALGIAARVFIWFESRRAKREVERRKAEEAASRLSVQTTDKTESNEALPTLPPVLVLPNHG